MVKRSRRSRGKARSRVKQSKKKKEIRSKKKRWHGWEGGDGREGKKHSQRWYEGSYYCTLLNETFGLFAQSRGQMKCCVRDTIMYLYGVWQYWVCYSTSVKDAGMRPRGAGNLKVIDINYFPTVPLSRPYRCLPSRNCISLLDRNARSGRGLSTYLTMRLAAQRRMRRTWTDAHPTWFRK